MNNSDSLVVIYLYLAIASGIFGAILVFVMLFISQYFGIDLLENWWLLVVPVTLAVTLNVVLVELYRKYRSKKQ